MLASFVQALAGMASKRALFTVGNPKTAKGESLGYLTAVLHLAPANVAGMGTVCAKATPECIALCLNTAGRGGIMKKGATSNAIQDARIRRTAFLKLDRAGFEAAIDAELARLKRKAKRMGLTLVVRINGTSDLPGLAASIAERHGDLTFYDYTKLPVWRGRPMPANLTHTFSRSESNADDVAEALEHGMNVAVVFSTARSKALPTEYLGRPVIDGDVSDLRFLDPRGVVVGLRAKGRARKLTGGFVVAA